MLSPFSLMGFLGYVVAGFALGVGIVLAKVSLGLIGVGRNTPAV
jgi:hypothetical protein